MPDIHPEQQTPDTQDSQQPPAWSDRELQSSPHDREDKPQRIRRMFAAIAHAYDLNNRIHSFGRDQTWRKHAVRATNPQPTDRVLDAACGTGDLSRAFLNAAVSEVVGLDFTAEMLDIARTKQTARPGEDPRLSYIQGDAMDLPFDDASFDIVSIAFGIRNVADPVKALTEFRRVLRPRGRLAILEFDQPSNLIIRAGNDLYTKRIMPLTATLISRDRSGAYRYLPKSVDTFLTAPELAQAIQTAGFSDAKAKKLTFGVCVCHTAHVQ